MKIQIQSKSKHERTLAAANSSLSPPEINSKNLSSSRPSKNVSCRYPQAKNPPTNLKKSARETKPGVCFSNIKSLSPATRLQLRESVSTKNLKKTGMPLNLLKKANNNIMSAQGLRCNSPQPELNLDLSEEGPAGEKKCLKPERKLQLKKGSVCQVANKIINQKHDSVLKGKEKSAVQLNPHSVNTSLHMKKRIDGVRITFHSPRLLSNQKPPNKFIGSPKLSPSQKNSFSCSRCKGGE